MINRSRLIRIIVEAVIALGLIIGFVLLNDQISDTNLKKFRAVTDKNMYAYNVEEIGYEGDKLVLKGWFFELNKVRNVENKFENTKKLGIVLYNIVSGKKVIQTEIDKNFTGLPMSLEYMKRDDVNKIFTCEYDYSNCGFVATINASSLDLENGIYQVVFKPDKEGETGIAIDSSIYISKGELLYINPLDKIELDVVGTDIEDIVSDGVCVASCPEIKICVYQYGWKLYWIAGPDYSFEKDGSTTIQYQIDTTQFEKLPESRKNGYYWDDNWVTFERHEVTNEMNCGKYRVLIMDIPEDYSVTRITTGYISNDKWEWKRYIRPLYNLKK